MTEARPTHSPRLLVHADAGDRLHVLMERLAAIDAVPGAATLPWSVIACTTVAETSRGLADADALLIDHSDAFTLIDALQAPESLPIIAILRPDADAQSLASVAVELIPEGECSPLVLERTLRLHYSSTALTDGVEYLAQRDLLTGLPNVRLFERQLEMAVASAQRHRRRLAVGRLALDEFDVLAADLGQAGTEALLVSVARCIQRVLRKSDLIARGVNDQFLLLLEQPGDAEDLASTADKLLAAIASASASASADIRTLEGERSSVRCSLGLAVYPATGENAKALLSEAAAALTETQLAGGGDFRFVVGDVAVVTRERLRIEDALPRAVERGELAVRYQPRLDLKHMRVSGAEVLARWHSPEFGEVTPDRFIPVAEASGAIARLGAWVLQTAMADLRRWLAAGHAVHLGVNVSAGQFRGDDFVARVRHELDRSGVPAHAVELEITERMFVDNITEHLSLFDELTALGVGFAVDDFGIGYSSLSYLKHFPVHALKIDRAFVAPLPDSQEDAAIVRAIVALGHALGLRVVAEGVEHPTQLAFVRAAGCDEAQGFLIGRGVDADAFEALLTEGVQANALLLDDAPMQSPDLEDR